MTIYELSLFFFQCIIVGCQGYYRVLELDNEKCSEYELYYSTQYQTNLINWNGSSFGIHSYCQITFFGSNDDNVITKYRVCFKTLDYNFDQCYTTVQYIDGSDDNSVYSYNCTTPIPDEWCTQRNEIAVGRLKIIAESDTNSRLKLEVNVHADISLSVGAAVGISFGCLAVIGIATTIFIIYFVKRKQKSPSYSPGRVI